MLDPVCPGRVQAGSKGIKILPLDASVIWRFDNANSSDRVELAFGNQ